MPHRTTISDLVSISPASGVYALFGPGDTGYAFVEPVYYFGVVKVSVDESAVVPLIGMMKDGLEDPNKYDTYVGYFDSFEIVHELNRFVQEGVDVHDGTRARFGESVLPRKETPDEAEERRKNLNR